MAKTRRHEESNPHRFVEDKPGASDHGVASCVFIVTKGEGVWKELHAKGSVDGGDNNDEEQDEAKLGHWVHYCHEHIREQVTVVDDVQEHQREEGRIRKAENAERDKDKMIAEKRFRDEGVVDYDKVSSQVIRGYENVLANASQSPWPVDTKYQNQVQLRASVLRIYETMRIKGVSRFNIGSGRGKECGVQLKTCMIMKSKMNSAVTT